MGKRRPGDALRAALAAAVEVFKEGHEDDEPGLPTYTPLPGMQTQLEASCADELLVGGAAGPGKALALDTPIPTPDGWTTMGDVQTGDMVLGDDGAPCLVVSTSSVMHGHPCYEVTFSDGARIIADADHLWVTMTAAERMKVTTHDPEWRAARRAKRPKRGTGKKPWLAKRNAERRYDVAGAPLPKVRTTAEIASTVRVGPRANHSVEAAKPLDLPTRELPVEPYALGLWLGDGTSSGWTFTTNDDELIDWFRACGYTATKHRAKFMWGISGLSRVLRAAGVVNNKHIPPTYLRASIEQRLALLQGLMDTDGTADVGDGRCEFTTMSSALRDGMAELVHSLGIKASVREGRATINGRDVGPKWRIGFHTELPAFRMGRKLALQKRSGFRGTHRQRYIVAVTPVASTPVKCIGVDNQSHCYLAGWDMIPTHNTIGAIGALRSRVKLRGYQALVLRRRTPDLVNAMDRAKEIYRDGRATGRFAFAPFAGTSLVRLVKHGNGGTLHFDEWGSRIVFTHCHRDDDYASHMGQEYDDIVFDEGHQFTRIQYEHLISRRRGIVENIRRRAIVTANPPEEHEPGFEWVRAKWAPWIDPECKVESWDGLDEGGLNPSGEYVQPTHVRLIGLPERITQVGVRVPPAPSNTVLFVAKDKSGVERFSLEPFVWNGVAAQSRTFIRGTLAENPAVSKDYVGMLRQLDPVRRAQLEEGDWTIRRGKGQFFQRSWFEIVDRLPDQKQVIARVRAWDKAASEPTSRDPDPDWTRGVKASRLRDGTFLIEDLASCRCSPGARDEYMVTTAKSDGKTVRIRGPQDPAAAGKSDAVAFRKLFDGYSVKTETVSGSKILRAGPASSLAHPKSTGGEKGRIKVLQAPWNDAFFAELESFPEGHDDIVDALSDAMDELVNHSSEPVTAKPTIITTDFDSASIGF